MSLSALCLSLLLCGIAAAQPDQQALERWQRLTPEQKQELRERYQRWQNLPPDEKEELQRKFEAWRRLPPEEKATAQKNFERWQKLSPEQRARLRERWQHWRELPPERREELKRRFEKLRELPPEERRRQHFQERVRDAEVYVRGMVRHPDHATIKLPYWHLVVMNTETRAAAMEHVAFLD